eukprot:2063189-Amphidinium_carterae.1
MATNGKDLLFVFEKLVSCSYHGEVGPNLRTTWSTTTFAHIHVLTPHSTHNFKSCQEQTHSPNFVQGGQNELQYKSAATIVSA